MVDTIFCEEREEGEEKCESDDDEYFGIFLYLDNVGAIEDRIDHIGVDVDTVLDSERRIEFIIESRRGRSNEDELVLHHVPLVGPIIRIHKRNLLESGGLGYIVDIDVTGFFRCKRDEFVPEDVTFESVFVGDILGIDEGFLSVDDIEIFPDDTEGKSLPRCLSLSIHWDDAVYRRIILIDFGMEIPNSQRIFQKIRYRQEIFCERESENDIPCIFDTFRESSIILGLFGEEDIHSDDNSSVSLEIINHPSVVIPFKILESSETLRIGECLVVDGNNRDGIIGSGIASETGNEDIADTEIGLLDEHSREIGRPQEWNMFEPYYCDDTENNHRNNRRDDEFILEIIPGFYFHHRIGELFCKKFFCPLEEILFPESLDCLLFDIFERLIELLYSFLLGSISQTFYERIIRSLLDIALQFLLDFLQRTRIGGWNLP